MIAPMKRSYVSYLFYVYSEMAGAVMLAVAAALEVACGFALGWDNPIAELGGYAAVFFTLVALCMLWSVYRAEVLQS